MLFPLALLFLSFLALPSLFIKRISQLQFVYNKIKVYRSAIGALYVVYGLLELFHLLFHHGITDVNIVASGCMIVLGFLLGFQWFAENLFAFSRDAKEKVSIIYFKLAPYEGSFAIVSLVLSIYLLIF